jgi:hypothetical protein
MLSRKPREEYWKRRDKVRRVLIEWGFGNGLVRDINREHPVGVLEEIIEATKKRDPKEPAKYFLNGLKHGGSPLSVSLKNNNP